MQLLADTVHRARAHVPGVPREARLATRLRVQTLLDHADWRPTGLPPRAVLLVRSVRARAHAGAPRGTWARTIQSEVDAAYRQAVRPRRGRVPEGAPAVLFADEAEWLACVLLAGSTPGGPAWWWPPRPKAPPRRTGTAAWLQEHPEHVPAILDFLDRMGALQPVLRSMPAEDARTVYASVAAQYGVAMPAPSVSRRPHASELGAGRAEASAAAPQGGGLEPSVATAGEAPGGAHRALVALSLTLVRSPGRVRAPSFRALLRRLLRESPLGLPVFDIPGANASRSPGVTSPDHERSFEPPDVLPTASLVLRAARERARHTPEPEAPAQEPIPKPQPSQQTPALRKEEVRDSAPVAAGTLGEAEAVVVSGGDDRAAAVYPGGVVQTGLAGVFYLLHPLEQWEVGGAFDAWRRRGMVSRWGLLEAIGRTLTGDAADPLWGLLARLDGREPGAALGAGVCGRRDFRLPPAWLGDLGGSVAPVEPPDALGAGPTFRRWLAAVAGAVRARVQQALGDELNVAAVLSRPGTVHASSSHLDLVQPLAAASLPVRRAGLDRDPGWLPRYGRVVLFHFEELP